VFAFVPTLAALPGWLYFEAHNPLDYRDPIVLAFAPVRATVALLGAFSAGVLPGTTAGVLDGLLLAAWLRSGARVSTRRRRALVGGACGALAGCLMIGGTVAYAILTSRPFALTGTVIAFELGSAVICGILAAPAAVRFLYRAAASVSASQ